MSTKTTVNHSSWFGMLLLASLLCVACGGESSVGEEDENLPVAADFALADADGNTHQLSELAGKVVVLNFFATWCGPCQDEMPRLEANIWQVYKNRNVAVLGIDLQEDIGVVKLYAINNSLTFPLAIDNSGTVFRSYAGGDAVTNVPYNVIVGQNGKIRYSQTGYNESQMTQLINDLLN